MKNFVIYAFVLTTLTIIYFMVMIFIDLSGFGKKNKQAKEDFDVSSFNDPEERSMIVEEKAEDGTFTLHEELPAAGTQSGEGALSGDGGQESEDDSDDQQGLDGSQTPGDENDEDDYADEFSTGYENVEYDGQAIEDSEQFVSEEVDLENERELTEKMKEAYRQMYDQEPTYQEELLSEDFATALSQPMSTKTKILRIPIKQQ